MNLALLSYEAELGQTSKGVWYVKTLKVAAGDLATFKFMLKRAIEETEKICDEHNKTPEPPKEEK